MIAWMIFGSKLLSSFSVSAIYSLLKNLRYKQTSKGKVENTLVRLGSPQHDLFFYPLRLLFGSTALL